MRRMPLEGFNIVCIMFKEGLSEEFAVALCVAFKN